MEAVFIRHNFGKDAGFEVLRKLWDENLIAVHFEDNESVDPQKYRTKAGQVALTRLKKCCDEGAIVGADFRRIEPSSILIGEIKRGEGIRPQEIGGHIYKTVQLHNTKKIHSPLLLTIQPRLTTITGWPSAEKYLKKMLAGEEIPLELEFLHPSQLEVICYEYLVKNKILSALLMPIGRTLRDVDIWGVDSTGKTVLAQVTFKGDGRKIEEKMKRLRNQEDSKGSILFFFGPQSQEEFKDENITYISIQRVFDELKLDERSLIKKMLQYESNVSG